MTSFFTKAGTGREQALVAGGAAAQVRPPMSWGAIIAGALTALVCQLVLNLLGLGIGLSSVDSAGNGTGAEAFSIGAAIWIVLTAITTYAIGGYVAGSLAGEPLRSRAGYHGLVTWALTTTIVVVLLTSAVGAILGGTLRVASSAFGGAGHALTSAAQAVAPQVSARISTDPLARITDQLEAQAGKPENAEAAKEAIAAVKAALSSDEGHRQQATDQAAQALAKVTGTTVDQARVQVEGYEAQYQRLAAEAKQQATAAAATVATTASRGALAASLSLIVGALAAFFAARFSAVRLQDAIAA